MITILIIAILIALIYVFFRVKYTRHKLFAIFLIILVLFFYLSVSKVLKDSNVDVNSFKGITMAGKLYMNWLVQVFQNSKTLITNAIKMEWSNNSSIGK